MPSIDSISTYVEIGVPSVDFTRFGFAHPRTRFPSFCSPSLSRFRSRATRYSAFFETQNVSFPAREDTSNRLLQPTSCHEYQSNSRFSSTWLSPRCLSQPLRFKPVDLIRAIREATSRASDSPKGRRPQVARTLDVAPASCAPCRRLS